MKIWQIVLLIVILVGLSTYEGLKVLDIYRNKEVLQETTRSTLSNEVVQTSLRQIPMPRPPQMWPESEARIKGALIKRGKELHIPLGEKDIALWRDESNFYCRVAWTQEIRVFALSLGSVLFDWTVEVHKP
ncbi:MAG: hypothetical protein HYZ81_07725 [Nitrospinae bacterium]|nr:hypothetical protein [Nitrospinota bacterium]